MQNLLNTLHTLGIQLSLGDKGDSLSILAPKGALTDSLRASIAQHKPALIRMLQRAAVDTDAHSIVPEPAHQYEPFALTDVQYAYWMGRQNFQQLGGVSTHFYSEFDSEGLDLPRLEHALQKLVERHGMLRAQVGDGLQKILPSVAPYHIEVSDVRGCSVQAQEAAMLAMRERMSHQVFAADRVPLFEVCAVRVSQVWARLYVSWDLLVVDASSLQLLFTQWKRFYDEPDWQPAPLTLSFRDYVQAELAQQENSKYEQAKGYWMARLASMPPAPDLPLCQGVAHGVGYGASHGVSPNDGRAQLRFTRRRGVVERSAWQGIKAQATALGCTPSVVLMAAFTEVLKPYFI
jgi:pyochelin synthetase